ncbi:MAG TPA: hypothetical protein VIV60_33950 [Polyangiaceae bacterium]
MRISVRTTLSCALVTMLVGCSEASEIEDLDSISQASSVVGSWSSTIPKVGDGTYKCSSTIPLNDAKKVVMQVCTRVYGHSTQAVGIIYNGNDWTTGVSGDVFLNAPKVYNDYQCNGNVPAHAQRACWTATYTEASGATVSGLFYARTTAGASWTSISVGERTIP